MIKVNKHIEIVCSTGIGLGSMNHESRTAAQGVLAKHYTKVGITIVNNLTDLKALVAKQPDLVFLGMKFVSADPALGMHDLNKIWVTQYLDEHGIPYTGSSQVAHELELNKALAKQRVLDVGLNTSRFFVALQSGEPLRHEQPLDFPLFVKPTNRGGGQGIDSQSVAHNFDELQSKINSIAIKFRTDSLVEEYLPGREFSVAIMKQEYLDVSLAMPIELIAEKDIRGARFLSRKVKSSNAEQALKVTDQVVRHAVCALALDVFYALGARDYGRIDIRLDKNGIPQFLEANLLPSLISGYGSFPKACLLNKGIDYESMILRITKLALSRSATNKKYTKTWPVRV